MRLVLVGLLALLGGCSVRSLNPLYSPGQEIFDERLTGEWRLPDGDLKVKMKRGEGVSYNVETNDDGDKRRFIGYTLKIGDTLFLDVYPQELEEQEGIIPVHQFYRVSIEGNELRVGGVREPVLQELLATRKSTAEWVPFRGPTDRTDRVLLTGFSRDLQRLMQDLMRTRDGFYDSRFVRN